MSEEGRKPAGPQVLHSRDQAGLAYFRTLLALDRTTLAWVRTTLTMASFGFSMVAFFRTMQNQSPNAETFRLHRGAIRMGMALILLGVIGAVLTGLSHWSTLRRLQRGESLEVSQWPLSVTVAMLIAIIGLLGLWELFLK